MKYPFHRLSASNIPFHIPFKRLKQEIFWQYNTVHEKVYQRICKDMNNIKMVFHKVHFPKPWQSLDEVAKTARFTYAHSFMDWLFQRLISCINPIQVDQRVRQKVYMLSGPHMYCSKGRPVGWRVWVVNRWIYV